MVCTVPLAPLPSSASPLAGEPASMSTATDPPPSFPATPPATIASVGVVTGSASDRPSSRDGHELVGLSMRLNRSFSSLSALCLHINSGVMMVGQEDEASMVQHAQVRVQQAQLVELVIGITRCSQYTPGSATGDVMPES